MPKLCPKCGTENRSDAKFCKGCGSALLADQARPLNCVSCGAPNEADAKSCAKCGAELGSGAAPLVAPSPSPLSPAPPPVAPAQRPAVADRSGSEVERGAPARAAAPRSSHQAPGPAVPDEPTKGKLIVIAVAALVLVIAGGAAWYAMRKPGASVAAPAAAPTPVAATPEAAPSVPVIPPRTVAPQGASASDTAPTLPPASKPQVAVPMPAPEPTIAPSPPPVSARPQSPAPTGAASAQMAKKPTAAQAPTPPPMQPERQAPKREAGAPNPAVQAPPPPPPVATPTPGPAPVQTAEPDWHAALKAELRQCQAKNFISRVLCEEKAKLRFCGAGNHWGQVPECVKTEHREN